MTDTKEPTTPEQARFLAASLIRAGIEGLPTALRSLADQLEAVTEARDNAVQSAKYTADLCTQALDDLKAMTAERDAVKLDAERYAKAYQHHHLGINGRICAICQFDVTDPIHIRAALAKEKTT